MTDDPDAALAQAAERFRHYATRPSYRRLLDLEGVAGPEGIAIVGNEAEVERRLRSLADIGVTDFAAIVFRPRTMRPRRPPGRATCCAARPRLKPGAG